MFSKLLEQSINTAIQFAKMNHHELLTPEHLLLALLQNPEVNPTLISSGLNLHHIYKNLKQYIIQETPCSLSSTPHHILATIQLQRILQRAQQESRNKGLPEVTGLDILSSIYNEPGSYARNLLQKVQFNPFKPSDVFNANKYVSPESEQPSFQHKPSPSTQLETRAEESISEKYTENFNQKAMQNKFDPLIGRDDEIMQLIQVLCQRKKNNPLLVGEAGVGKTAIVEGLAQKIVGRQVPGKVANATIHLLDLGLLLAGAKFRGEFELRFKAVLQELSHERNAIIFIDEIHSILSAGSTGEGTMDAASLIKPLLSTGQVRCIGATTYEDFRKMIAKDRPLLRRFQKIDIQEPSEAETFLILKGIKSRFESFHNVQYTEKALKRAIELSGRYLSNRHLPDKAIDVIDEAGAYHTLQSFQQNNHITPKDIETVIAKKARIPLKTLSTTDKTLLKTLPQQLQDVVFGQNQAIEALSNAVQLARSGLHDPDKPMGSFLLAGPTGVGKTEVTKQLAQILGVEFIRFDMSEYMERHAVARLIGAPPGYVGFEQGGLLTEAVNKHPHAILLLDEIEKAHPDIYNILLQVMDYGRLTDNCGRKTDFHHVMIVMTTNAGAEALERHAIGFADKDKFTDAMGDINRIFSPEFRNRLDAIIQFKYLDNDTIEKVLEKSLSELKTLLKEKNISLNITPEAKSWLTKAGYNRNMGARPMMRLIKEKLKLPLATEMLYGELTNNQGQANVIVKNNDIHIECHP